MPEDTSLRYLTVEEEIRETFTAPGKKNKKLCLSGGGDGEEFGGLLCHKVADESHRDKSIS